MRVKACTAIAAVATVAFASSVHSLELELKIDRLERMFATDTNLEVVNRIDALPQDVVTALRTAARWEVMADWGERWNATDMITSGDLTRQHIFSAVSPEVVAILFRIGGWSVETRIIIADRASGSFCRYDVEGWLPLDVGRVQAAIAGDRGSEWKCNYHP